MGRSIYDGELTDERKANIQKRCNRIMTAAIEMSEWARKSIQALDSGVERLPCRY